MTPRELIKTFCELNGLPLARFEERRVVGVVPPTGSRDLFGSYVAPTKTIRVVVDLCHAHGEQGSWHGWLKDCTVLGVTAHELGHHLSACQRVWRVAFRELRRVERAPTPYATMSVEEDIAESVMLHVTNPSLLAAFCPLRSSALMTVKTPETRHWTSVLADTEALSLARKLLR